MPLPFRDIGSDRNSSSWPSSDPEPDGVKEVGTSIRPSNFDENPFRPLLSEIDIDLSLAYDPVCRSNDDWPYSRLS